MQSVDSCNFLPEDGIHGNGRDECRRSNLPDALLYQRIFGKHHLTQEENDEGAYNGGRMDVI